MRAKTKKSKKFLPSNLHRGAVAWGWVIGGLIVTTIVAGLLIYGSEGNVHYYMTASEYRQNQERYLNKRLKLAGRVKLGSLSHEGVRYEFIVEDQGHEVNVKYEGFAPDTFKEGSEVVVEGRGRSDADFVASSLMAKCASKYNEGGLPPLESMRKYSVTDTTP